MSPEPAIYISETHANSLLTTVNETFETKKSKSKIRIGIFRNTVILLFLSKIYLWFLLLGGIYHTATSASVAVFAVSSK